MRNPLVLIGIVAVAAILLLIFVGGGGDRRLDTSVMGTDGLGNWLRANQIEINRSSGRSTAPREDLSMAILPLYDTNVFGRAETPETAGQRMADTSPREAQGRIIELMQQTLPTLVMLPKWRNGFALTGIAHEQTQIPKSEIERVVGQLAPGRALRIAILEPENRMFTGRLEGPAGLRGRQIALFRPQFFDRASLPDACTEQVGVAEGALIVSCRHEVRAAQKWGHFLSDPDLLNNHGLRLADNADLALALVAWLRDGDTRAVLLAQAPVRIETGDAPALPHQRTAEDLSRFFAWPLSALWAMAGVVLALALWRGARRFGPPRQTGPEGLDRSRRAAIAAKARLLRLSGADGRMATEHVRAHLADLAVQALGPGAGNDPGIARWFALLTRRNQGLATEIRAAADRITPQTSPAELPRLIDTFHALTRKASDAA